MIAKNVEQLKAQKAKGRQNMLTYVRSFTFWASLVERRLSTTAQELNNLYQFSRGDYM
jgi:hypothetical protein